MPGSRATFPSILGAQRDLEKSLFLSISYYFLIMLIRQNMQGRVLSKSDILESVSVSLFRALHCTNITRVHICHIILKSGQFVLSLRFFFRKLRIFFRGSYLDKYVEHCQVVLWFQETPGCDDVMHWLLVISSARITSHRDNVNAFKPKHCASPIIHKIPFQTNKNINMLHSHSNINDQNRVKFFFESLQNMITFPRHALHGFLKVYATDI